MLNNKILMLDERLNVIEFLFILNKILGKVIAVSDPSINIIITVTRRMDYYSK